MELTRYDREKLGQITGSVSLAGHAAAAFWAAWQILSLPMEAGGLVLGPIIGLPLVTLGMVLLSGAAVLARGRTPHLPFAGLGLTVLADGVLLANGVARPLPLIGVLLSAASLAFFVSLATFSLGRPGHGPRDVGDQAVLMVVIMAGAAGLAFVLAGLAP